MSLVLVLQHTTTVLVTGRGGVDFRRNNLPAVRYPLGLMWTSAWEKVAQLVGTLRHKPGGRGFDWNLSLT